MEGKREEGREEGGSSEDLICLGLFLARTDLEEGREGKGGRGKGKASLLFVAVTGERWMRGKAGGRDGSIFFTLL